MRYILYLIVVLLTGCTHYPQATSQIGMAENVYRLRENDIIKLRVYEEPEFSGQFKIDGMGRVALPLAGKIDLRYQTEQQAAATIETHLRHEGLLNKPKVSVELAKARPFFILGEVTKSGQYEFHPGLTVYQAVAMAGGFTYRADRKDIIIRRQNGNTTGNEQRYTANEDTPIFPGDAIEIGERYF